MRRSGDRPLHGIDALSASTSFAQPLRVASRERAPRVRHPLTSVAHLDHILHVSRPVDCATLRAVVAFGNRRCGVDLGRIGRLRRRGRRARRRWSHAARHRRRGRWHRRDARAAVDLDGRRELTFDLRVAARKLTAATCCAEQHDWREASHWISKADASASSTSAADRGISCTVVAASRCSVAFTRSRL